MIRRPRPEPMSLEGRDTPSLFRETTAPEARELRLGCRTRLEAAPRGVSPCPRRPKRRASALESAALILTRLTSILNGLQDLVFWSEKISWHATSDTPP